MSNFRQGTELPTIHIGDVDPTLAPGIPGATPNVLYIRTDNNSLYYFAGPTDTDWRLLGDGVGNKTKGGTFNADGTPQSSRDCSVVKTGLGLYTCTYTNPFVTNSSVAAIIAEDVPAEPDTGNAYIYAYDISATGFKIATRLDSGEGPDLADLPWSFVATETQSPIT